jgi:hypothetical protein
MQGIATVEKERSTHDEEHHSFSPEKFPVDVTQRDLDDQEKGRQKAIIGARRPAHEVVHDARKYLPCHYFDYIGGSGSGA